MMASIYGLYGADGRLRYIGKAENPANRIKSHMRDARRRMSADCFRITPRATCAKPQGATRRGSAIG